MLGLVITLSKAPSSEHQVKVLFTIPGDHARFIDQHLINHYTQSRVILF